MINLSTHVTLEEMTASQLAVRYSLDNTPSIDSIRNLKSLAVNVLEPVRALFNKPMIISSGYRSLLVNQKSGGAVNSQHVTGNAVDFTIFGVSVTDTFNMIMLSGIKFDQMIFEFGQWIHISNSLVKNRQQLLRALKNKDGHTEYQKY